MPINNDIPTAGRSRSVTTQISSFFQAMFNRMVGRAQANNKIGSGHIGSSPVMSSNSGDLGAGAVPIGNISVYPDSNSEGFVKEAYSGNATIYTIVSRIAKKFAHIPRNVYEVKDKTAASQYKHFMKSMDGKMQGLYRHAKTLYFKAYNPATTKTSAALLALLANPNPMQGQDAFFDIVGIYEETLGEAVVWLNRGTDVDDLPLTDGPVLEMWALPPQYMEIVPDPFNVWGSLGWIFNVAGKRIPIDNENIIHWKKNNPNFDGVTREHMRGMSPLRPGRKKLTEDESATDASVALNQNQGAKGIAFDKSTTKMTPEKETQIRGAIDRKVNNKDMRGAVAMVQGDLGYLDISMSSQDMELETRKDNIFDRLCNLFGIPPDLFKTNQTYQNVLQARKDFMTDKVLPMSCSFNDEMNRVLLPAFGISPTNFKIDIDVTQVIELQDDMTLKITGLLAAYWMTPNERRLECDQEESDGEGMDDIWIPNTLVKMEDAAMPPMDPGSFDPTMPGQQQNDNDNPQNSPTNVGGKNKQPANN